VAFTKDPALAIWQAMQPLAAIHLRTDTPAIAKILAEAETILFGLILALVRRPNLWSRLQKDHKSQTARIATDPTMSHGTINQLTIDSLLRRCMRRKACCRSLSALS